LAWLEFALAGLLSWVATFFLPAKYAAVRWIVVSCIGYCLLYTLPETTVKGIGIFQHRTTFFMLAAVVALALTLSATGG
jgi:hypothetical protein